jgi:hypothetical protein
MKKAKDNDKVSDDLKAAKFFHFGHVLRDPRPAKPSEAYIFVRRLSESEAREEVDGLPLPLKAYATNRRQKIRRRPRSGPVHMESKDSALRSIISKSIGAPLNNLTNAPTGVHGLRGDSNVQVSSVSLLNCYHFVISKILASVESGEKVQERP